MSTLLNSLAPDLTNQIAVVTGASRGIGEAIARALGACGAHTILAARSGERLERTDVLLLVREDPLEPPTGDLEEGVVEEWGKEPR